MRSDSPAIYFCVVNSSNGQQSLCCNTSKEESHSYPELCASTGQFVKLLHCLLVWIVSSRVWYLTAIILASFCVTGGQSVHKVLCSPEVSVKFMQG